MANGKKSKKLRDYFVKHPETTIREAALACSTSYASAWAVRKKMCDDEVTARAADIAPVFSIIAPPAVSVSDGSTASYYELPEGAKELQDLISYKDMNAQMGEIFRGTYRYGQASHSDRLRDAKKIKFYIDAEIKRLEAL